MAEPRDEFYVGYLPMPVGYLRFVRIGVPVALWLMVLLAAATAVFQRSPGRGEWDTGRPVQRVGILRELPYPHLVDGDSAVFLVEQGKRGAQQRSVGLDGQRVRVTGWKLARDGREVLELVPEAAAIEPLGERGDVAPTRLLGTATLAGEVIDYKCYLGAMKPGDGKTHKACAILCLTGGIPAMLVDRYDRGPRYTLLADPSGGPVGQSMIELAGEPVEVSGQLVEQGPVRILRVERIRRR